jgi:hypothetical protein
MKSKCLFLAITALLSVLMPSCSQKESIENTLSSFSPDSLPSSETVSGSSPKIESSLSSSLAASTSTVTMPEGDLSIRNYSSYQSLGIATASSLKTKNQRKGLYDRNQKVQRDSAYTLIGENGEGNYEQLIFTDDSGKDISPDYDLVAFEYHQSFSLIQFAPKSEDGNFDSFTSFISMTPNYCPTYLLGMKSGKLYRLTEQTLPSFGRCQGKDTLYTSTSRYSEKDGKLVIEKFNNLGNFSSIVFIDRYDHAVYLKDDHYYVLDEKNVFTIIPNSPVLGYDGRIYFQQQNADNSTTSYVVGEDGNSVVTENYPAFIKIYGSEYTASFGDSMDLDDRRITTVGNKSYYCQNPTSGSTLIKTETAEDGSVTVSDTHVLISQLKMPDGQPDSSYTHSVLEADNYLYYLSGTVIKRYSMETDTEETILEGYVLSKIYSDNKGHVVFEGTDSHLNSVIGYITSDGKVDTDITIGGIDITYITPIN